MRGLQLSISNSSADRNAAPASSPLARSAWVDRLNEMLKLAWERGWSPKPNLDTDMVVRDATKGLSKVDFAHRDQWLKRLDALGVALRQEARLNELGLTIAYGQLVRMVRQRTKLELLWQHNPQILKVPVPPPIVVLGHMRSGTTRVQRILACDPRFSATRFCDAWYPVPPSGPDLRPVKAWATLRAINFLNPQFFAIHPTTPTAPDEEIGWLALDFSATPYDAQWRVPSFEASSRDIDKRPTYELVKRLLQTHYWRHPSDRRPRILKVPQFMNDVDALLSVFPEASIVRVTRDLPAVVASSCSLVSNQRLVQSDEVDLNEIGTEWLARTVRREVAANERLARHARPVAEVNYRQMDDDWRAGIAGVYSCLGMQIGDDLLDRMDEERANPQTGKKPHRYRLEDFGLTADCVLQGFRDNAPVSGALPEEFSRRFLQA